MPLEPPVVDTGVAKIVKDKVFSPRLFAGIPKILLKGANRAYVLTVSGKYIIVPERPNFSRFEHFCQLGV